MVTCELCQKRMPAHILEKHMAKSHPGIISTAAVTPFPTTDDTPPMASVVTVTPAIPDVVSEEPKVEKPWDMGEMNTCQQCHEVWPSRLMELHMHVRHGL